MAGAEGKSKKSNNKPRISCYDFNPEPFEMPLSAAQINSFSVVQTNSANHFSVTAADSYELIGCLAKCRATVPKLLVFPHYLNSYESIAGISLPIQGLAERNRSVVFSRHNRVLYPKNCNTVKS